MAGDVIAIGADHAGFDLKERLKRRLRTDGYEVLDVGTDGPDSVDYPDFAHAVGEALGEGRAARGVVVCGSGIGVSIAANRHAHVRAALCQSVEAARLSRCHNDANVLALGARLTEPALAEACLEAFLITPYEGGRHDRRLDKLAPPGLRPTEP
jgi:ribose 5-phosphate isomerase B